MTLAIRTLSTIAATAIMAVVAWQVGQIFSAVMQNRAEGKTLTI